VAGRRAHRAPPPRAHSQHFLRPAWAAELVRDAGVRAADVVVDVGAGSGRLTAPLAAIASRVVAIELDPRLAAGLRGRWSNVEVIQADAASVRLPREPFRVVANLPFSRTNDLLHHLLDHPETPLERADVIVQWGVARKRGVPWPSTVNSVVWGALYEASIARRLPPAAFEPQPGVDAGVLVFRRRAIPLIDPPDHGKYRSFVARGFRHGVRTVAPVRATARELDPHQWAVLWNDRLDM
jgi:23S rRNA (adenine-N6)-dimethyltransferase